MKHWQHGQVVDSTRALHVEGSNPQLATTDAVSSLVCFSPIFNPRLHMIFKVGKVMQLPETSLIPGASSGCGTSLNSLSDGARQGLQAMKSQKISSLLRGTFALFACSLYFRASSAACKMPWHPSWSWMNPTHAWTSAMPAPCGDFCKDQMVPSSACG